MARTALLLLLAIGGLTACQTATTPERRELLGSWASSGFPGATIRMTVTETARAVQGAGSWLTLNGAEAFQVSGAFASDEVSLHFEFDGRPDINFQGYFEEADILVGHLTGDEYRRQPIRLEREDLLPDD